MGSDSVMDRFGVISFQFALIPDCLDEAFSKGRTPTQRLTAASVGSERIEIFLKSDYFL